MPPAPMVLTVAFIESRSIPEPNSGCWIWLGSVVNAGYGGIGLRDYPRMNAHRASYIVHKGDVPAGLDVDHLCRTPLCVNPAHLEAISHQENCRRRSAHIPFCKNGHPYDYVDVRGSRRCRICDAAAARKHRAALASAKAAS